VGRFWRCGLGFGEGTSGCSGGGSRRWAWWGRRPSSARRGGVELLFAEWSASGAMIRHGPTNFPRGSLEIQVTDPDGHVLRFASDGKDGKAMGPWMDAEGKLWPVGVG
jgi:hypothetical protein